MVDLQLAVACAIASIGVILASLNIPRIWKNHVRAYDRVPAWWQWGAPVWRGFVRAIPVGTVSFGLLTLAMWFAILFDNHLVGRDLSMPLLLLFGLAMVCLVGIYLFNQPWFLVPPHLQRQPGALLEWYRGLASRLRTRRRKQRPGGAPH
jgi:hypothetical protein